MNNLHHTLKTNIRVIVAIRKIAQVQLVDFSHNDLLVLDHRQFHNHLKNHLFGIVIVIRNSAPLELHHDHNTLTFINNKETQGFIILISELTVIVPFLHPSVEIDSIIDFIFLFNDPHQDHV